MEEGGEGGRSRLSYVLYNITNVCFDELFPFCFLQFFKNLIISKFVILARHTPNFPNDDRVCVLFFKYFVADIKLYNRGSFKSKLMWYNNSRVCCFLKIMFL